MSKFKDNNSNSLNISKIMNNISNNSDEHNHSVNQFLMPVLQPYSSGMSSHCYILHRSTIQLPKFSSDPQELNLFRF